MTKPHQPAPGGQLGSAPTSGTAVDLRPGARVKLIDQGVTLLDCIGEVQRYSLERDDDGVHVTLHIRDPQKAPVVPAV